MAEQDIKIKDAPLVENIKDSDKIPVSDGSGLPKAVSIGQIIKVSDEKINEITKEAQQAIDESKVQTEIAKELNSNPWKIDDTTKHIMVYNTETKAYKDTGLSAMVYPDISQDGNDLIIQYQ